MSAENLIGRKITYAKLQNTDAFVPTIGALGSTLPPLNKSFPITMVHTEAGLYVNVSNGKAEVIVPWGNVQLAVYDRDTKPTFSVVETKKAANDA